MQKGSVASITQSCARHGVPTGHRLSAFPLAVVLLGLTGWLGCDSPVGPGAAVEVQASPAGTSMPDEVAGIEVYRGAAETPAELGLLQEGCGVIAIWTRSR
jgi:hypothetical protein